MLILPSEPNCPTCTQLMTLTRVLPRLGGLPDLHSFECKTCTVVFSEVASGDAALPERVIVLHEEACQTPQ